MTQGYLIKPKPVRAVYITGGKEQTNSLITEFLQQIGLEPVLARRNDASVSADWRTLAKLYNDNLQALAQSDLCLALLDGTLTDVADVCVEMGLAFSNGIPILGLCSSDELRACPMVMGMCRGDEQLAYDANGLIELVKEHIEMVCDEPDTDDQV